MTSWSDTKTNNLHPQTPPCATIFIQTQKPPDFYVKNFCVQIIKNNEFFSNKTPRFRWTKCARNGRAFGVSLDEKVRINGSIF